MLKLTKYDLTFLARLDLNIEVQAVMKSDGDKDYWVLKVCTERQGIVQEGILHGARGEERRFQQLNALIKACQAYLPNCTQVTVPIPAEPATLCS